MLRLLKSVFSRDDFDLLGAESSVKSLPLGQQIITGNKTMIIVFRLCSWDVRAPWPVPNRHNKSRVPRIIYQTHIQASESSHGFVKTSQLLYKHQGVMRFYRGALPILMGCIPAHAAFFGTYEFAKTKLNIDDGVAKLH